MYMIINVYDYTYVYVYVYMYIYMHVDTIYQFQLQVVNWQVLGNWAIISKWFLHCECGLNACMNACKRRMQTNYSQSRNQVISILIWRIGSFWCQAKLSATFVIGWRKAWIVTLIKCEGVSGCVYIDLHIGIGIYNLYNTCPHHSTFIPKTWPQCSQFWKKNSINVIWAAV